MRDKIRTGSHTPDDSPLDDKAGAQQQQDSTHFNYTGGDSVTAGFKGAMSSGVKSPLEPFDEEKLRLQDSQNLQEVRMKMESDDFNLSLNQVSELRNGAPQSARDPLQPSSERGSKVSQPVSTQPANFEGKIASVAKFKNSKLFQKFMAKEQQQK